MEPSMLFFLIALPPHPLCPPGLLDEWMDERMDEYITKHFSGMDVFENVGGSRG